MKHYQVVQGGGGTITGYNSTTGTVTFNIIGGDACSVYFDELQASGITLLSNTADENCSIYYSTDEGSNYVELGIPTIINLPMGTLIKLYSGSDPCTLTMYDSNSSTTIQSDCETYSIRGTEESFSVAWWNSAMVPPCACKPALPCIL